MHLSSSPMDHRQLLTTSLPVIRVSLELDRLPKCYVPAALVHVWPFPTTTQQEVNSLMNVFNTVYGGQQPPGMLSTTVIDGNLFHTNFLVFRSTYSRALQPGFRGTFTGVPWALKISKVFLEFDLNIRTMMIPAYARKPSLWDSKIIFFFCFVSYYLIFSQMGFHSIFKARYRVPSSGGLRILGAWDMNSWQVLLTAQLLDERSF